MKRAAQAGGAPAQAVGDERQEQDQADAKEDGGEPEPVLAEGVEIPRRARQPPQGEGGVTERRAVMFVGVVFVAAMLPKLAELDAVDGLVVVHRALVQGTTPHHQREGGQQDDAGGQRMEE